MKHNCSAAALIAAIALPLALPAQPTPPPPASADDDAVRLSPFEVNTERAQGYRAANSITASRFALPILDTPMAINVVTEEFMRDIGARDQLEALAYVSGITQGASPVRLEGSNNFNIRGVSTGFSLRDGVLSYGINDGYNIERYEVLKGIVGMMYGDRNLGGVINAVSKKPREAFGGEVFTRTDEYGSWRIQGDITGPLNAAKTLLFRVNAFAKDEQTFMRDEHLAGHGITTALAFTPFDSTRLNVEYEYYKQNNTLATKLPPLQNARGPRTANDTTWVQRVGYANVPKDFNYGGTETYLNEVNRILSGTLDQRLLDWLNFRSHASYSVRAQDRLNRDGGATFLEQGFATNSATDNVPVAPRQIFDFATGLTRPETPADVPYVTTLNSNLRENRNWNFIWRNDLLAEYSFLDIKHRTLVGLELQERSGDFKSFDSYAPVTLDARNPVAAQMRALDARGRVNVDIRQFDPRLPLPTREEFYARVQSDPNDQFGNFNGSTNQTRAYYITHYAQALADRLTVMGGLRQDRDRTKSSFQRQDTTLPRPNGNPRPSPVGNKVVSGPTNWSVRNSPQVGAAYRLRDDLAVYVSWSRVLVGNNNRGPVYLDELSQVNGVWTRTVGTDSLEPQMGENKEIGLKTEFLDGRLSGTLAVFETTLTNKPFTIPTNDINNITQPPGAPAGSIAPFSYTVLAGEEQQKGVELDATWAITNQWSTLFSYAFIDAKVTRDSNLTTFDTSPAAGNQNISIKNFEGYQKGNVPKHQFKFWSTYRFNAESGLLRGASIGSGFRYYTDSPALNQYNSVAQTTPAYLVVDLSLNKKVQIYGRDLGLTLRVKNLLDEDYIGTRQIYGEPREFVLEARYRF